MTRALLIILGCCLLVSPAIADDQQSEQTSLAQGKISEDNDPFSEAHEFHRYEAEQKARANMDERFLRTVASQATQAYSQDNYDVLYYDVYIKINDTINCHSGRVRFVAVTTEPGVSEVIIDLNTTLAVDSIVAPSGLLSNTHEDNLVAVQLGAVYDTGEQFEFDVWYHDLCLTYPGMHFSGDRAGTFSEPYWAPEWWPCKDEVNDKPDSMGIAWEVDTSWYAASNGTLDSVVAGGSNTHIYYYTERYPIAHYLFSVVAGHLQIYTQVYTALDGQTTMPIVNALHPSLYDTAQIELAITPGVLTVFAEAFGEYPFLDEKYGHGNYVYGGMEHQTMTTMGDGSILIDDVIIHEAAHQWWGDMITCGTWADIWLNEGMATWSEGVYWRHVGGDGAYYSYMTSIEYTTGGTVYCDDTTNAGRIFSLLSYYKGAWVMYQLEFLLGDSLFNHGMRSYYNSPYQYGTATTADFKGVMEEASGMDLDFFFDQWVYGEYFPNFHYWYTSQPSDEGGYDVSVVVKQVQTTNPDLFVTPLEFGVYTTGLTGDTVKVFMGTRREHYKFHLDSDIASYGVWLDPCNRVLDYNTYQPEWTMFITTTQDEIAVAIESEPYVDTIEAWGGSGDYSFTIVGGSLPSGFAFDSDGILSGSTTDLGTHSFTVSVIDNIEGYTDEYGFEITIEPPECCGVYSDGFTGNVNRSIDGKATLSDITMLIDHVFISKQDLDCMGDGNVNGSLDEKITLSDITRLVDHVFIGKGPTEPCL